MSDRLKIVFLLMPKVHLLDLGSVAQIFFEAKDQGLTCDIDFCQMTSENSSSIQVPLGKMNLFSQVKLKAGDYIIIPSSLYTYVLSSEFKPSTKLLNWLQSNYIKGVTICSLSNSALLLAKAGLLDHKTCTTHWLRIDLLRQMAPNAKVLENILFYEDDRIITSAGAISCIDFGLYIISKLGGGKMAYEISKKLLLYNIRKGHEQQISVFLKYRNHTHSGIHKVQDYLTDNISQVNTISDLANYANMSERNFTRIFKRETGKTVKEYITELRVEKAKQYIDIPEYSRIQIANECGLQSERHLRRILQTNIN